MRKVMPYLGASLSAVALLWGASVNAQEPFKDVPKDHWAYEAVTDLQAKGIIIGYDADHFGGKRNLTRYEFAVALKRALDKLPKTAGEAGPKGDRGDQGPKGDQGDRGEKGADGTGLSADEIDKLHRLTDMFRTELTGMGVDIKDIKSRLDSLAQSVAAINRKLDRMPVITGDVFFGFRGVRSRGPTTALASLPDYSGAALPKNPTSIFDNMNAVHDFHLGIHANLPGNVKFHGDLVSSNYLSYRGGSLSAGAATAGPGNGGLSQTTTLYQANLAIPISQVGRGTELTIGRLKNQVTPLTFYRPDFDSYFDVPAYDDGNYVLDGFKLESKFGSASTQIFGGSFSSVVGNTPGSAINTPFGGAVTNPFFVAQPGNVGYAQAAGLHVGIPLGRIGELGATLIDLDSGGAVFAGGGGVNLAHRNLVVYGTNLSLRNFGRFHVSGEAAKTVAMANFDTAYKASTYNNDDNNAYTAHVGYDTGPLTTTVGYQYIDPKFSAPGNWNKIGFLTNPVNIAGPFARVGYKMSDKLSLSLGGDFYSGARNRATFNVASDIARGLAGVNFHLNKTVGLTADYEIVSADLSSAVTGTGAREKPIAQYITLGTNLHLSGNTVLKMAYQILSSSNAIRLGGDNTNASVLTTQVAVHF